MRVQRCAESGPSSPFAFSSAKVYVHPQCSKSGRFVRYLKDLPQDVMRRFSVKSIEKLDGKRTSVTHDLPLLLFSEDEAIRGEDSFGWLLHLLDSLSDQGEKIAALRRKIKEELCLPNEEDRDSEDSTVEEKEGEEEEEETFGRMGKQESFRSNFRSSAEKEQNGTIEIESEKRLPEKKERLSADEIHKRFLNEIEHRRKKKEKMKTKPRKEEIEIRG